MRWPKSRFKIGIIVFDELELIIFVSQGLTLSTASLVRRFVFMESRIQKAESHPNRAKQNKRTVV